MSPAELPIKNSEDSGLKTASMLWATDIKVECPHCHEKTGGYLSDPRGHEIECEFCGEKFKVHPEADVELDM